METVFADLMAFFGIAGVPSNFAELVPWLFQVLCAIGITLSVLWMIRALVSSFNRSRF